MSAYSTIYVSREKAIEFIHSHLNSLNNAALEDLIDIWLNERLYRAYISDGRDDNILKDLTD